ncbi:MAG: hypothetical protein ACQ9MH_24860 [Nitrospinales bacterium]
MPFNLEWEVSTNLYQFFLFIILDSGGNRGNGWSLNKIQFRENMAFHDMNEENVEQILEMAAYKFLSIEDFFGLFIYLGE